MKPKDRMPDYLKLFIRREAFVVLGRKWSNVWLLTAVLFATFFAVAFANGSLNYLNFKMNDPFIKWVEIKRDPSDTEPFVLLNARLGDSSLQDKYHFGDYSYDYERSCWWFGKADSVHVYLKVHYFDVNSNRDLVSAIMGKDNRISGIDPADIPNIDSKSLGVFITAKALERMGYDNPPAYLDLYRDAEGASAVGFKEVSGRVRVPIPLLGVVRRLPGNVDMVGFTNLYRQIYSPAFMMTNNVYGSSLNYFLPEENDEDEFAARLSELLEASTDVPFVIESSDTYDPKELYNWKNKIVEVDETGYAYHHLGWLRVFTDTLSVDPMVSSAVNAALMEEFGSRGAVRIYPYEYSYDELGVGDFISIQFRDLEHIRPFAEELVNACGLEAEMSQINSKENFQSVSTMGIALSVVMVIFAVVCILLFLVNLLRSYFQKVKRNIGTFKAFGISNRELEKVYLTIILFLVGVSLAVSLAAVSLLQILLQIAGIGKGDGFGHLALWNCNVIHAFPALITVGAIVFVLLSAVLTVRFVMKDLLSATPGDLIYDR